MKPLKLSLFVLHIALPMISQAFASSNGSEGGTVKSYSRKDGTQVSGYTRHAASDPSSSPGSGSEYVFPTPESQQTTQSQQPVVVYYTTPRGTPADSTGSNLPVSKSVTSNITSNAWRMNTLVVQGTLTNTDAFTVVLDAPVLVGFDKNGQVVNSGKIILNNPELEAGGTEKFTAEILDAQRAIRFTKVSGIPEPSAAYTAPTNYTAPTVPPVYSKVSDTSSSASSGSNGAGVLYFLFFGAIGIVVLVFLSKLGTKATAVAASEPALPEPTANEAATQQETLNDLRKGIIPERYNLSGFMCKKNEKVLFSFKGVRHYHQGTHSEWTGRSAGVSVKIAKGLWFRTGGARGHSVKSSSMDCQGEGDLVLTNQGFSFIGLNTTRIPFTHILSFEPYLDGFGLDTDYARNNKHVFDQMHPTNATFVKDALDLIGKNGGGFDSQLHTV